METANKKQSSGVGSIGNIKALTSAIPGVGGSGGEMDRDLDNMQRSRAGATNKDPNQMSPQEVRSAIWPVLVFRDNCKLIRFRQWRHLLTEVPLTLVVLKIETVIGALFCAGGRSHI